MIVLWSLNCESDSMLYLLSVYEGNVRKGEGEQVQTRFLLLESKWK